MSRLHTEKLDQSSPRWDFWTCLLKPCRRHSVPAFCDGLLSGKLGSCHWRVAPPLSPGLPLALPAEKLHSPCHFLLRLDAASHVGPSTWAGESERQELHSKNATRLAQPDGKATPSPGVTGSGWLAPEWPLPLLIVPFTLFPKAALGGGLLQVSD